VTAGPPFVSICIATYQRAELLRETLGRIVPQLGADAELVVVDGGSTDATRDVVTSFGAAGPVRYIGLASKGGVDHDFDVGLRESRGEYVWFFCDDDYFEPGALGQVVSRLRQHTPDVLIVNGSGWDDETQTVLKERFLDARSDRFYPGAETEQLFQDVAAYITYIGAVVVRRSLWLSRRQSMYSGSELAHVGVIFHEPLPRGALTTGDTFIRLRLLSSQWTARAFRIWMINWPRLVWSLEWLPASARSSVVGRRPWRNLAKLLVLRAAQDFDLDSYRKHVRDEEPRALFRLGALVVACIPGRPLGLFVLRCYELFAPGRQLRIQQLRRRLLAR
jgi:glycosyltransferase involved in cell wall biosynthesis